MVLVMLYFFVFAVTSPRPARLVHLVALRLDLSDNVQARVEESVHAVLEAAGFLPDRQRVDLSLRVQRTWRTWSRCRLLCT